MAKISRITKQKELMETELEKVNSFFTAEGFFNKLKKKNKKISIATIYRFLKELRKERKLHSYLCNRRLIYSKEKTNHCHFICQKCNKVIHFDVDEIDFLRKKIRGDICHFQIDVHGICDKCLNNANK